MSTDKFTLMGAASAAAIFVLDAFWLNQGLLSFGAALLALAAFGLKTGRRHIAVCFLLAAAATQGSNRFQNQLAKRRAQPLIAAIEQFRREHGRYPASLDHLVPGQLPAVPHAKATWLFNRFEYRDLGWSHELSFIAAPPHGRRVYHFEDKRWGSSG